MMKKQYTPREMIEILVSFDTTSRVSNLELIAFVSNYLALHGIESHLIHNEDHSKANLYATLGPAKSGGIFCPDTRMWCLLTVRTGP